MRVCPELSACAPGGAEAGRRGRRGALRLMDRSAARPAHLCEGVVAQGERTCASAFKGVGARPCRAFGAVGRRRAPVGPRRARAARRGRWGGGGGSGPSRVSGRGWTPCIAHPTGRRWKRCAGPAGELRRDRPRRRLRAGLSDERLSGGRPALRGQARRALGSAPGKTAGHAARAADLRGGRPVGPPCGAEPPSEIALVASWSVSRPAGRAQRGSKSGMRAGRLWARHPRRSVARSLNRQR